MHAALSLPYPSGQKLHLLAIKFFDHLRRRRVADRNRKVVVFLRTPQGDYIRSRTVFS
jgi:hypothetical protein